MKVQISAHHHKIPGDLEQNWCNFQGKEMASLKNNFLMKKIVFVGEKIKGCFKRK